MAGAVSGALASRGGGGGGGGRGRTRGEGGEGDGAGPARGGGRKIRPRQSQLMRAAPADKAARAQVLAANLDLVVIVVPCPPRPTVIDRFLAIATRGGCTPLVCANKVDLADRKVVEGVLAPYRLAAIRVVTTSALTGEGVRELRGFLDGRLSAFLGPSGAGKSSLINVLDPSLNLRVASLTRSGRGSHTTSWAAVYQVGAALIVDTPGLREIGFIDDEGQAVAGSQARRARRGVPRAGERAVLGRRDPVPEEWVGVGDDQGPAYAANDQAQAVEHRISNERYGDEGAQRAGSTQPDRLQPAETVA